MRTEKVSAITSHVDVAIIDSPPRNATWSMDRRLSMKPPPGAPVKSAKSRPYLPNYTPSHSTMESLWTPASEANCRTLILPSKTIDEDDDCMAVTLPFRPTRLTFSFSDEAAADPTTVLLGPMTASSGGIMSWHDEDDNASAMVEDKDDNDISPRLFHRFGEGTLWRYESIEIAEDESDAIFRSIDEPEDEPPSIQERFTSSPLQRSKDDVRV
jgi:hypothetical protein